MSALKDRLHAPLEFFKRVLLTDVARYPNTPEFLGAAEHVDRTVSDWYKDAIVYQLHVKAFQDANAAGLPLIGRRQDRALAIAPALV